MKVMPIREIAKEVRISFRDIGAILNKVVGKKTQGSKEVKKQQIIIMILTKTSSSSSNIYLYPPPQAYKLFSNRKTLLEVAIALNLRESEAIISIKSIGS
jgi:DNA topoisomerase VI subunit B